MALTWHWWRLDGDLCAAPILASIWYGEKSWCGADVTLMEIGWRFVCHSWPDNNPKTDVYANSSTAKPLELSYPMVAPPPAIRRCSPPAIRLACSRRLFVHGCFPSSNSYMAVSILQFNYGCSLPTIMNEGDDDFLDNNYAFDDDLEVTNSSMLGLIHLKTLTEWILGVTIILNCSI